MQRSRLFRILFSVVLILTVWHGLANAHEESNEDEEEEEGEPMKLCKEIKAGIDQMLEMMGNFFSSMVGGGSSEDCDGPSGCSDAEERGASDDGQAHGPPGKMQIIK